MKRSAYISRRNRSSRTPGTKNRPRLMVLRSLRYTSAQLIDDESGKVILGVNEKMLKGLSGTKTARAKEMGTLLAKKAMEKGIKTCIFDRRGYKYHGRVKSLADGAREGGLKF